MRLMSPLFTEKSCLQCHARHGYKEGDLRGGISIAIPMKPLYEIENAYVFRLTAVHLVLLVLGLGGVGLWWIQFSINRNKIENTEKELSLINS